MLQRETYYLIDKQINSRDKKAIILIGARQVGKKNLLDQYFSKQKRVLRMTGDDPKTRMLFEKATLSLLRTVIGDNKFFVIDEAQRIPDIGVTLKLLTDNMKDVQVVASGSSSFELTGKIYESLAGRKREIQMFPLSCKELCDHFGTATEWGMLQNRLVYGSYPEVVTSPGEEEKILTELVDAVLYKDILSYERIKKSDRVFRLIQALAYQIGSQVSYNELGQLCGLSSKTVETYINVLEKAYIIFTLGSYSRKLRNELKFSKKIYFMDNGIRNAVISKMIPFDLLGDVEKGALWENYILSERIKRIRYDGKACQCHFWRTTSQQEIDYVEECDGHFAAYEFKWNSRKAPKHAPKSFSTAYEGTPFEVITPDNYLSFLLPSGDNRS